MDKFLNEADLRGRIESGEVDPEVLENLIEAVRKSEKSNVDTVNTVENDVMKKLHPEKTSKNKNKKRKGGDVQTKEDKPKESNRMSLDDLFDIPMDGLDTGDDEKKKGKKKSSSKFSGSSSSNSSNSNAKKSNKKAKEVDSPSPPEDGRKGLLDEI